MMGNKVHTCTCALHKTSCCRRTRFTLGAAKCALLVGAMLVHIDDLELLGMAIVSRQSYMCLHPCGCAIASEIRQRPVLVWPPPNLPRLQLRIVIILASTSWHYENKLGWVVRAMHYTQHMVWAKHKRTCQTRFQLCSASVSSRDVCVLFPWEWRPPMRPLLAALPFHLHHAA